MKKRSLTIIALMTVATVFMILTLSFLGTNRNSEQERKDDVNLEENVSFTEDNTQESGIRNNAEKVLREDGVRSILEDFAAEENYSKISDENVLRDTIVYTLSGQESNLADRIVQVEKDLETRSGELADAPDARSFFNARVKFCLAKSIFSDDLKNACEIPDPLSVNFSEPDDLTASEEVLPYFLIGLSYYEDKDYSNAESYLKKIEEHKQSGSLLYKDSNFPLNGTNDIYNRIYDKSKEILLIISAA